MAAAPLQLTGTIAAPLPHMVPVLSAFYFGTVEHYRLLARHPQVIVDVGEHYVRQSYRTRTGIVGPNGRQDLSVQVVHDHGHKMPMHQVAVSYAESWPQQHLHAIRSAYGKTPWAIHFLDHIEAVFAQRHARLVDLDLATMRLGLKWLGLATEIEVRENYMEESEVGDVWRVANGQAPPHTAPYLDLRSSLHPKKALPPAVPQVPPYTQVFADRHGFVPRLSVIDLLCNCGPEAKRIVRE